MVDPSPFHQCLYLTGSTASGKTAVGIALARRLGAEVVALDSMTLYRGLDIGTAKPTIEERAGVPHHLIDVLDPWQAASVADYRGMADLAARDILSRGRRVLFVGGTPLYLKTLLRGLFEGPSADPLLRAELEQLPAESLWDRLQAVDPETARRLHPRDRRRIIRAVEVHTLTGRPISQLQSEHDQPAPAGIPVYALDRPRATLHQRINQRVLAMFRSGLVQEVQRLLEAPRPIHPVPAQAVGYREVIEHLTDPVGHPLDLAIERVQGRTRQFAKRQATWFRGLPEVQPWPVGDNEPPEAIAERLAQEIEQRVRD